MKLTLSLACIVLSLLVATDGKSNRGLERHFKRDPIYSLSGVEKREESRMLLNEARKVTWFTCLSNGIEAKYCDLAAPGIEWTEEFKNSEFYKSLKSD